MVLRVLYRYYSFVGYVVCKYFLLIGSLSFHILKGICDIVNGIDFDEVWLIYESFLSWVIAIGPLFFLLLRSPLNSLSQQSDENDFYVKCNFSLKSLQAYHVTQSKSNSLDNSLRGP